MTRQYSKPGSTCPKCGYDGFIWSEPRYRFSQFVSGQPKDEWLEWECKTCGYIIQTKVFEAENET